MKDEAIQWFLDDAKAQGLSVRDYERRYGIILLPAEHEINDHEVPISASAEFEAGRYRAISTSDDLDSAGRPAILRLNKRRRPLTVAPPYEPRLVVADGAVPEQAEKRRRARTRRQSACMRPDGRAA